MTSSLGLRQVGARKGGGSLKKNPGKWEKSLGECEGRQPPWAWWGPPESAQASWEFQPHLSYKRVIPGGLVDSHTPSLEGEGHETLT